MRLSQATRVNLARDRRVLGKAWGRVYSKYFSDRRVLDSFVGACSSIAAKLPSEPTVLYVCSGTGLLGGYLSEYLRRKGFAPRLTLVDASAKQLRENKNRTTEKIAADLLNLRLGRKFDLIIMRSSLDYFPSANEQVKALSFALETKRFFRQPVLFAFNEERT
ncbi:MAG: class I SAM-dependent methyltransferase [Candidatus Micrarchaeota archaeon]